VDCLFPFFFFFHYLLLTAIFQSLP
jgi:hypothetical protein